MQQLDSVWVARVADIVLYPLEQRLDLAQVVPGADSPSHEEVDDPSAHREVLRALQDEGPYLIHRAIRASRARWDAPGSDPQAAAWSLVSRPSCQLHMKRSSQLRTHSRSAAAFEWPGQPPASARAGKGTDRVLSGDEQATTVTAG